MYGTPSNPIIGLIGGMGPHAGIDLAQKVTDHTEAGSDQEHLPSVLLSFPNRVADRTAYLLGRIDENPVPAILDIALTLDRLGATVAGMACNTAHAPILFDALTAGLAEAGAQMRLLHLINEAACFVRTAYPHARRVGVLSTMGTYRLGLYPQALARLGLEAVVLDEDLQEHVVHAAIYDPAYGIKAQSRPVTARARERLALAVNQLKTLGAEAVILGCTELPLALPEATLHGLPLVDATTALARALIRETYPDRLKHL